MHYLSHPAVSWLLDGSTFSMIVLTCLVVMAALWAWTRWIEWGLGVAMVMALIVQMVIRLN